MKNPCFLLLLFLFSQVGALPSSYDHRQVYIVYLGGHSGTKTQQEILNHHHSFLLSVKTNEEEAKDSMLYSYKNSINGFAAYLSKEEAAALSQREEVVSAFPSQAKQWALQTTRSWDFIGLEEGFFGMNNVTASMEMKHKHKHKKDIIVGLLDSGIWPESKSFSDAGMGPVPKSWRGICQEGDSFSSSDCNRKLIGARYYIKAYEAYYGPLNTSSEYRSPRDHDGHGSHTSSTVAGRHVPGASALGGYGLGLASGGAPRARIAMYKVCWPLPGGDPALENTCFEADMLAAMDDALSDGVDVLSISIGTTGTQPAYSQDGIALGALHAVKKGVVVSCSAGNSGPTPATSSNLAPWIITVGASSIDRVFYSPVILGNGIQIKGQSVTPFKLKKRFYPLVFAADVVVPGTPKNITAGQCLPNSLAPEKVKGKIVFCFRGNGPRVGKGMEVKRAGGAAVILGNLPSNGNEVSVDANVLPGTTLVSDDAIRVMKYINSTKIAKAMIKPAVTLLHTKPAPFMAAFSSTGPNALEPNIIKPDITAPGLNILAAWSRTSSPTKLPSDDRRVNYNIISGTSMSCPHVAAAATNLKAAHPKWSSAAIRSALMTTATTTNRDGDPITDASGKVAGPFNYGSGHLRPEHAMDPGLVYDASYIDYLLFVCANGTSLDPAFPCPKDRPSPRDLNHPSVAVSKLSGTVTIKRTVTNVGGHKGVYSVTISPPPGVAVDVSPSGLSFWHKMEKKSFLITLKADEGGSGKVSSGEYTFGWYSWSDGVHVVRSPIAVSLA
ncbi:Subtilisin-like protease [Acorus calamus]|uniref:Subtilisin-like protease n=1 Tax=Acorus calamus TaxID=4465 RepID=A0AAV9F6M4_ACOCL|nr:Subtilisin-like protease [Acorus calamus]